MQASSGHGNIPLIFQKVYIRFYESKLHVFPAWLAGEKPSTLSLVIDEGNDIFFSLLVRVGLCTTSPVNLM